MNTVINNILNNDDELFNRVRAYGPGDGINRIMVTVEDSYSVAEYGLRETTQSFPNATDISDLTTQATAYLSSVSQPKQDVSVTYYFSANPQLEAIDFGDEIVLFGGEELTYYTVDSINEVKRGDTIRIASRDLKDTEYGTFTGVVQEIDWQPGQVTFLLGQPAYNILEVITGPERTERRTNTALRLPTPIGFTGYTSNPGITVRVNPYTNSRAVGVEIYADTSPMTISDITKDKLVAKANETTFHFPDFATGQTFYFRARTYDSQGNVSGLTDEIQVVSGYLIGAPRLLYSGIVEFSQSISGVAPPYGISELELIDSNVTIPVGKKYIITAGILEFFVGQRSNSGDIPLLDFYISRFDTGFYTSGVLGATSLAELSSGTYTNIYAKLVGTINSVSGATPSGAKVAALKVSYQVYEVDV